MMRPKNTIESIRNSVQNSIGKKANIAIKKGRRVIVVNDCTIQSAYVGIFTLKINGENMLSSDTISISYADLLIGNARLSVLSGIKEA